METGRKASSFFMSLIIASSGLLSMSSARLVLPLNDDYRPLGSEGAVVKELKEQLQQAQNENQVLRLQLANAQREIQRLLEQPTPPLIGFPALEELSLLDGTPAPSGGMDFDIDSYLDM